MGFSKCNFSEFIDLSLPSWGLKIPSIPSLPDIPSAPKIDLDLLTNIKLPDVIIPEMPLVSFLGISGISIPSIPNLPVLDLDLLGGVKLPDVIVPSLPSLSILGIRLPEIPSLDIIYPVCPLEV